MAAKILNNATYFFLLYQSVMLISVSGHGIGVTTPAQIQLLKLDRVRNEVMRVIQGATKDTTSETMRFMLASC